MSTNQTPPRRRSGNRQPPWLLCTTVTDRRIARVKSGPSGVKDLYQILIDLSRAAGHVPPQPVRGNGYIVSLPVIDYLKEYARGQGEWILVRELKR
jgi:hypothetical protein